MADLYITVTEEITLNNINRGVTTTQTLYNINNIDNRILSCPTGSYTGLFYFNPSNVDAATFTTGSFQYGRITNRSTNPVKLLVTTANGSNETFLVSANSSFFLSTALSSGSLVAANNYTFNDCIREISVEPSGSASTVEYFIATN